MFNDLSGILSFVMYSKNNGSIFDVKGSIRVGVSVTTNKFLENDFGISKI